MANITVKDASGNTKTLQASDNTSVLLPAHQIVNQDGTGPLKVLAEDAAHSSGDTGIMALGVRKDTPDNLSGTDGDYEPLQVSSGRLWTSAVVTSLTPGTGATDIGKAEDAAHTSGDVGIMSLGVRNDTHTTSISGSNGDYTPLGVDSTGKVGIRGTFAEDSGHTSGDLGVQVLSVRQDTAAALAGTDADYQPLITDSSGRLHVNVGSFTPGTTASSICKAEDAAHNSGDAGIFALAVRSDSAASTGGTDGDYVAMITDSTGRLWTHCSAVEPGTAATSLGKAEDGAHTTGDVGVMGLAVRQDTPGNLSGTDGDYEPLQVSAGRLWVSAAITAVVPGTSATSLGKAEDAAHTSGDVGVMSLGVRNDTHTAAFSGTDGDYTPIGVDSTGKVGIRGTFAEDSGHTSGDLGVFTLAVANATHTNALSGTDGDYTPLAVDTTGKLGIRGTYAEDASHSSGDLGVLALARRIDTCASSAGTSGDYATINQDANGRAWARAQDDGPAWTSVFGVSGAAVTSSDLSASPTAITDAPTAGQKIILTDLLVSSGAAISITFTEETSGTVIAKVFCAANSTTSVQLRGKVKLATADKKLMAQASGAGALAITAVYYSEA